MTRANVEHNRFAFDVADLNTSVDGTPRMLDLLLANALGFARPSNIRRIISRHLPSLKRFGEVCSTMERTMKTNVNFGGRPGKAYYLNKKQALYICTKSDTENATEVTIQMVEVFDAYKAGGELVVIEKPIHVQAHDRRTSVKVDDAVRLKKNIDRLESVVTSIAPAQPNFCAMVVDGEPVFVDTNRYSGAGRAVVMGHDGRMYIEYVEPDSHGFKPMGVRTAMGQRHATPGGGTGRNAVMVVGMVMESAHDKPAARPAINAPALNLPAPDRQAVVDQVTGELRGQIMTLLDAVPWDDQRIARELRCNPKLVREVRRVQSSKSPAVQPLRQIEHESEQRPKRTVYRDQILRLFKTGMTNREIAQETGATYQAVTHWRRWAADRA